MSKNFNGFPLFLAFGALFLASGSHAASDSSADRQLAEILKQELARKIPGARIELSGDVRWIRGTQPEHVVNARVLGTTPRGEAQIVASDGSGSSEGFIAFSAWLPVKIAVRRIMPGEALTADAFNTQEVNVASGQGYDYRGVMLAADIDVGGLESRQTILEGQFLISSAVKKIPDVRRGDVVRVNLVSNGVTLSTAGVAEEAAYVNGQVRILAQKTKRELVGKLGSDKVVEVRL